MSDDKITRNHLTNKKKYQLQRWLDLNTAALVGMPKNELAILATEELGVLVVPNNLITAFEVFGVTYPQSEKQAEHVEKRVLHIAGELRIIMQALGQLAHRGKFDMDSPEWTYIARIAEDVLEPEADTETPKTNPFAKEMGATS